MAEPANYRSSSITKIEGYKIRRRSFQCLGRGLPSWDQGYVDFHRQGSNLADPSPSQRIYFLGGERLLF